MDEEEEGELCGHEFSSITQHSYLQERCVLVFVLSYKVAKLSFSAMNDV